MASKRKAGKKVPPSERIATSQEKQFDAFLQTIKSIGRTPWSSVYDYSFKPYSASKFLENMQKLKALDIPEEQKYKAARDHAGYSRLNGMSLWLKACENRYKFCATGTNYFFKTRLPNEYPEYVQPGATYTGVRKNEKMVALNSFFPVYKKDSEGNVLVDAAGKKRLERIGNRLWFECFVEQAVGLNLNKFAGPPVVVSNNVESVMALAIDVSERLGVPIKDVPAGSYASFSLGKKELPDGSSSLEALYVQTPPIQSYTSPGEYACALAHEFAHASHFKLEPEAFDTADGREGTKFEGLSDSAMSAYKEVVAEFTAASIAMETGILTRAELQNSAAYIKNFTSSLEALGAEKKFDLLYRAASIADRVMEFMIDNKFSRTLDIDVYISQLEADAQKEVENYNLSVASWAGKEVGDLTNEDRIGFVKAQVEGFEPKPIPAEQEVTLDVPPPSVERGMSR